MISKKDIIREYKEHQKPAGVFQVKNTGNGRVFLGSSLNLEGVLNSQKFKLSAGIHPNRALQKDWSAFGPDKFVFEILEEVKDSPDINSANPNTIQIPRSGINLDDELASLEQIWLENREPFGEKGYNTDSKIRQV